MSEKKPKIIFDPGFADNLDVSQEELDEIIDAITNSINDGTFEEQSEPLDIEKLIQEDPEGASFMLDYLEMEEKFLADHNYDDPKEAYKAFHKYRQEQRQKKLN